MSLNDNSDLRLEISRQRQAHLLAEAERDRLARSISASAPRRSRRIPNPSQLISHLRRNRQALPREAR